MNPVSKIMKKAVDWANSPVGDVPTWNTVNKELWEVSEQSPGFSLLRDQVIKYHLLAEMFDGAKVKIGAVIGMPVEQYYHLSFLLEEAETLGRSSGTVQYNNEEYEFEIRKKY